MCSELASLLRSALALPERDREWLTAELLASLGGPDEESPDGAERWAREIERRINRFANGESPGVDLVAARQRIAAALSNRTDRGEGIS